MSVPVLVVTGVTPLAMERALVTMTWDLPGAVGVRHTIDVDRQALTRVVSDASGVIERVEIDLDHACASCALREDVVPTLIRLAEDGRWSSIVAALPVGVDATAVCRMAEYDSDLRSAITVSSVVAVLDGPRWEADLLGDELMRERGVATSAEDGRGVAEALSYLVEYADVVVGVGGLPEDGRDLAGVLARPTAEIVADHLDLATGDLIIRTRELDAGERWVDPLDTCPIGVVENGIAWTIELRSDRPFHPGRLHDHLLALGGGPRRSRGSFWLPSRPGFTVEWSGAGGQLSIGEALEQRRGRPLTRLLVSGIDEGVDDLLETFAACLLTDEEIARDGVAWSVADDGFTPWLGPIRHAA